MKTIYCDLKAGMTREEFLNKCSLYEQKNKIIIVSFDTEDDMNEFDAQCMCFTKEKCIGEPTIVGKDFHMTYDLEDLEELERNITYLVTQLGWVEEEDY